MVKIGRMGDTDRKREGEKRKREGEKGREREIKKREGEKERKISMGENVCVQNPVA